MPILLFAKILFWPLIALALSSCSEPPPAPPPQPAPETLRRVSGGELIGWVTKAGAHAWTSVPYAAPPVGSRRWRSPSAADSWQGQRKALQTAPPCAQIGSAFGLTDPERHGSLVGQEDCLFLNIWSPPFAANAIPKGDASLPVMLWVHGGGNVLGHGAPWNGATLAATQQVIVISVNYRLGPLGWFHHPQLNSSDHPENWSGNYGTLDIVAALRWVRDNIDAFGGDPDNVTLFGESAGGRNILSLLVSPIARGLFHRAIVSSGGTGASSREEAANLADEEPPGHINSSREVTLRLLISTGRATSREEARGIADAMSTTDLSRFLRSRSLTELFAAYTPPEENPDFMSLPNPILDGQVLPAMSLSEALKDPELLMPVPVILGSNRDETKLFMAGRADMVQSLFGAPVYLHDSAFYNRIAYYSSAAWKAAAVDEPAAAIAAVYPGQVFTYRWDWDELSSFLMMDFSELLGAAHALEIPFILGDFEIIPALADLLDEDSLPGRLELSQAMMHYWTQFAHTGDPGRGRKSDLPVWKPFTADPGKERLLVLDSSSDGNIRMSADIVRIPLIIEWLAQDNNINSQEQLCQIFNASFQSNAAYLRDSEKAVQEAREYIGAGGCPEPGKEG